MNNPEFCMQDGVLVAYTGHEAEVTVPEGVVQIGERAFAMNQELRRVILPEGVIVVRPEAFFSCPQLEEVVLPKSLLHVGDAAFRGCHKMADSQGFVIVHKTLHDYFGTRANLIVPDGVTRIAREAFQFHRHIVTVALPDSVLSVGDCAFCGCTGLKQVILPESLIFLGNHVFRWCRELADQNGCFTVPRLGRYDRILD